MPNNDPLPTAETWLGAAGSDWNTPANWSGGVVPTSGTDVVIPSQTPTAPALSDATLSGDSITLAGGTVDFNNVVLESELQGSGAIVIGGTLTIGAGETVDAGSIALTGTSETIVNDGLLLDPHGTNGWGATTAATLINNGTIAGQSLALTALQVAPNGVADPFAGGPQWMVLNAGSIVIEDGGSFDLNGTISGGAITLDGTVSVVLEQGMAFANGASLDGVGPGDGIVLADPQAGNDFGYLGWTNGALDVFSATGTLEQAIPMSGSVGLGDFEMMNVAGTGGEATISAVFDTNSGDIDAPTSATVQQGQTLSLGDIAIAPAYPADDYFSIAISVNSGTLYMNGADGSGTNHVVLGPGTITGGEANLDLASLVYVPAAGSRIDMVTISVEPPAMVALTRSIPITVTPNSGVSSIAAADADPLEAVSHTVITASSGDHMIFVGGTGDTLTATGGTEVVQAFQGQNTITTGAGNDTISIDGSGNIVNTGGGTNLVQDSGSGNTIVMPAAGTGMDNIFGQVLQGGDTLDFRTALAATAWNGDTATIGDFLHMASAGANAVISLSDTSGGAATQIAVLNQAGPVALSTLLAHALT